MSYRIIISLLFSFLFSSAWGQVYTKRGTIEKIFPVNPATTVEIYNKYGKIHVITWNRDSVKFFIDLVVKSSKESRLTDIRDNVNFDFTGTKYYVTAKTEFGSSYNSFLADLLNLASDIISSENQVEINYTVHVPGHLNLKINNKFGDIYLDNYQGDVKINLSNGDLKANELKGSSDIQISMGDGEVHSLNNGKIFLSYSEFRVETADQLTFDSKISRIHVDKVNTMKLSSKKDKFYISEINQLFGKSYFSDIWIYNIDTKANFNLKYGNINMESIHPSFSFIDLNAEYTDLNLYFEKGASYHLDISHKDSFVRYPEEIADMQKKVISEEEKKYISFGKIGKGEPDSKVKINATRGNVSIYHR